MFSIKLAGVLSRAEEKTLYLAVRYSVGGREIWDNNSGRNYQVRFVREKALKGNTEASAAVVESREESSRADDIADLQRKLGELVELGCPSKTVSGILAQESRRRCESPPPAPSPPLQEATPSFKSEGFVAGRYDFAASSRTPWRPPAVHQTLSPARTHTLHARTRCRGRSFRLCAFPVVPPTTAAAEVSSFFSNSDLDDPITPVPSLAAVPSCGRPRSSSRNHTRGGTIVLSHAPGVKRTPPTSPLAGPALSTFPFLPLSTSTSAVPQPQPHAYFDSSMPSITSNASRSPNTSPNLSPAEPVSPTRLMPPVPDTDKERDSGIHHLDYHNIVNRYGVPFFFLPGDVVGR